MPRKTKIIFIASFIIVIVLGIGFYSYLTKTKTSSTVDGTGSGYKPFFGGTTTQNNTSGSGTQTTESQPEENQNSNFIPTNNIVERNRFSQITNFAVAGAVFFEDNRPLPVVEQALSGGELPPETKQVETKTTKGKVAPKKEAQKFEFVPSIRYVERSTGHIYQMYLDTKATGKVSNSTIPNIYETFFDGTASSVLYRYLDQDGKTITSFLATLGSNKGEFLPNDILDASVSPDKTKFFYLTKSANGVVGTVRMFKDIKKTQVFNSSLSELLSQWVAIDKIYLTTKASGLVEGSLFSLNITNGVMTKIWGGVRGLTTVANKDGAIVLYSSSLLGSPKLGFFNAKDHTSKEIGLYGLPEKCIWSNDAISVYCAIPDNITSGIYPDSWYQGLTSFNDHFVKINSQTGEINSLSESYADGQIDATHLFLDKAESKLFFINKKDSTLWSLDLAK